MHLKDIRQASQPLFSFEFFPPKNEQSETNLFETAKRLDALGPAFFSMTYGAGGSTRGKTVQLAHDIQTRTGVDTMCHLTCVDQSRDEVRAILDEIETLGMRNILALRGDPPQCSENWEPHPEGFHYASELVGEIRRRNNASMSVAVAGFPEKHPDSPSMQSDLKYLKVKVDAGADAIVTQLFYDNAAFFAFEREVRAMGIDVPIIPGIMPILNAGQVRRFCATCQAAIPVALDRELDQYKDDPDGARDFGADYAARQIQELFDRGVPAVHIYCLNRAYSVEKIIHALNLPPAPPPSK